MSTIMSPVTLIWRDRFQSVRGAADSQYGNLLCRIPGGPRTVWPEFQYHHPGRGHLQRSVAFWRAQLSAQCANQPVERHYPGRGAAQSGGTSCRGSGRELPREGDVPGLARDHSNRPGGARR
jgi:hypothetical protein